MAACLCVAILGVIGMVTTWKAPAALACGNNSPCYAIGTADVTEQGVYGQLYISCNYVPNNVNAGWFATNEVWNGDTSGTYFTEAGVFTGVGYNTNIYYTKSWFWADSRPFNGDYHEHPGGGTATTGLRYPVQIVYAGNSTWNVYGGNSYTLIGQSMSQPLSSSGNVEAGTEYTVPSGSGMRNVGSINELQYKDQSGTWTFWGSVGHADPDIGPGGYITPGYSNTHNFVTWTGPC